MTRAEYKLYLQSDHWREVKAKYWKSKLLKECYVCGAKGGLQLHHRTYRRVGGEYLRDLLPLCDDCHVGVHKLFAANPKVNLWNAAKRYKRSSRKRHKKRAQPKLSP